MLLSPKAQRDGKRKMKRVPTDKREEHRHGEKSQTSDRDIIKVEIFRSHDRFERIYKQKGKGISKKGNK